MMFALFFCSMLRACTTSALIDQMNTIERSGRLAKSNPYNFMGTDPDTFTVHELRGPRKDVPKMGRSL